MIFLDLSKVMKKNQNKTKQKSNSIKLKSFCTAKENHKHDGKTTSRSTQNSINSPKLISKNVKEPNQKMGGRHKSQDFSKDMQMS